MTNGCVKSMAESDELVAYLRNTYGNCRLEVCNCLKQGWHNNDCPYWQPTSARTWDELLIEMRGVYEKARHEPARRRATEAA